MTVLLRRLDWVLLLAVLALVALSALLVWSATSHRVDLTDGDSTAYLRKQLVNIVIGAGPAGRRSPSPTTAGCGSSRRSSTCCRWPGWCWC